MTRIPAVVAVAPSVMAVRGIPPCESALTVMVGNPLKEGLNVIDGKASPGNGSARGVQDAPNNAQTLRRRRRVILSTGTKTDLAAHIQFAAR